MWALFLESPHALLLSGQSGRVLYQKNAREAIYPASTTKMATALYALHLVEENDLDIDQLITITPEMLKITTMRKKIECHFTMEPYILEPDGSRIWIRKGEKYPLRTLLYGMMLASGNDAANAVAEGLGGTIPHFVEGLNQFVQSIGCQNTHFVNPHGLHHPDHKTTTFDLALIGRAALNHPFLCEILNAKEYTCPYTNGGPQGSKPFVIRQENLLVTGGKFHYKHSLGGKTGYTKTAGSNLVAISCFPFRSVIAVVNNAPDKLACYRDIIQLFNQARSEKTSKRLLYRMNDMHFRKTIKRGDRPLFAILETDVWLEYFPSEEPSLETELKWANLTLPVRKNDKVGYIEIRDQNAGVIKTVPLYAASDIHYKERTWPRVLALLALLSGLIVVTSLIFQRGRQKVQTADGE
ncbi:MAG: D-alanyl-D-alanine carboxypeptidase DacB [Chlamydiia bacterium]|nr:D-alanyl-D-alanine carboxypeptidase DacB [Chlamydiia bacterium]